MNKRIKELAVKCATQLDWDFPSDPKEYTFSPSDVEKFAELIVNECIKELRASHKYGNAMAKKVVRDAARDIRKHLRS